MFINRLSFNKFKLAEIDNNKEKSSDVRASANNQEVTSPEAACALKALNFGQNKNYVFLQNIKIPNLNLDANLYMLKNGQKCLVAKKDGPAIIRTYFKVGSMNEPDNLRGISHYIEHNLFNGSENLKSAEFVERVNAMGGKYNASTGFVSTDYFIQSPLHNPTDLEEFIRMHSDMIARPTFAQDMLDKEKGPVISEIQMLDDNPERLAINTALKNLFNIKTTSNALIAGSVDNIQQLKRDDVLDYYNTNYTPQNALTVVIGDVDEKETLNLLDKYFSNFQRPQTKDKNYEVLTPIDKPVRTDLSSANAQSTIVNMAFAGPKNNQSKTATNMLLYALAGYKNARLSEALRKMNTDIAAGLETMGNLPQDNSAILLMTVTANENPEDVLKLIYQKVYEMSVSPMSDEELKLVKEKMKHELKYAAESNFSLSTILGSNFITDGNFNAVVSYEKDIDKMTPADIMNAARTFLDLNKASISVVHPEKKNNVLSFAGNVKKLDITTYRTPNNVAISTLHSPNSQMYSMNFELKSDILPNKAPINYILRRMLSKGTAMMPEREFYDIEDRNDIVSNFSVKNNVISANYTFPKESMGVVLDNLHKNIFAPALTKENFEKAKKELQNDYLAVPKSAQHRAQEVLYAGSPAENTIRKAYVGLQDLKFEDVIDYYNKFITNAQCETFVSGNFEDKSILNQVYSAFSNNCKSFAAPKPLKDLEIKALDKTKVVTEPQERNQSDIVQMFRMKETGNVKDKAAILLLNEVLGGNSNSRLFADLREKQKLAYAVRSNYQNHDKEGILSLTISTTTDNSGNPNQYENLQKSIDGFKTHIKNLISTNVSDKELEAAKLQLKSKLLFNIESTAGKNGLLTSSMHTLYKDKYFEFLINAIDNTNADDLRKIASYYLSKPSVISIIGSKNTLDKNESYLKSLGELEKF